MHATREFRIFVACAVAQLRNGNESLARGPINSARPLIIDAFADVYDYGDDTRGNLFSILVNLGNILGV